MRAKTKKKGDCQCGGASVSTCPAALDVVADYDYQEDSRRDNGECSVGNRCEFYSKPSTILSSGAG
jgi:hypothetical protein